MNINDFDFKNLIVYATRYALKRHGREPSIIIDIILKNWRFLSVTKRKSIKKEISSALGDFNIDSEWNRVLDLDNLSNNLVCFEDKTRIFHDICISDIPEGFDEAINFIKLELKKIPEDFRSKAKLFFDWDGFDPYLDDPDPQVISISYDVPKNKEI